MTRSREQHSPGCNSRRAQSSPVCDSRRAQHSPVCDSRREQSPPVCDSRRAQSSPVCDSKRAPQSSVIQGERSPHFPNSSETTEEAAEEASSYGVVYRFSEAGSPATCQPVQHNHESQNYRHLRTYVVRKTVQLKNIRRP